MSNALTASDVWKMFEETNRMFQESQAKWELRHQETERAMREARAESERVLQGFAERAAAEKAKTEQVFRELADECLPFFHQQRLVCH
ncbi:MAG: hypothetical protein HQM04_18930 [Magnetococcales bacterium]|nr:hypothetical protein [Magnetococcales bacterium]MBF0117103.1 hypothetical protein [Magnetococcales bacterium]